MTNWFSAQWQTGFQCGQDWGVLNTWSIMENRVLPQGKVHACSPAAARDSLKDSVAPTYYFMEWLWAGNHPCSAPAISIRQIPWEGWDSSASHVCSCLTLHCGFSNPTSVSSVTTFFSPNKKKVWHALFIRSIVLVLVWFGFSEIQMQTSGIGILYPTPGTKIGQVIYWLATESLANLGMYLWAWWKMSILSTLNAKELAY